MSLADGAWRTMAATLLCCLATSGWLCSASFTPDPSAGGLASISPVTFVDGGGRNASDAQRQSYPIASINFQAMGTPFAIAFWVFVASLARIGFHMTSKVSAIFPESVLLIVLGVVIGLVLFYTHLLRVPILTPTMFFMFMLPPIVLDAGYFMPNRLFFDNLGTILIFAMMGTVLNTVTVGVSLWAVGLTGVYGVSVSFLDTFLFSALISATDPVAVLAVFEELQVDQVLYILVFGESLLNDAVTVVLYNMFQAYTEMGESNIIYTDVLLGCASFFVVALGGTLLGIVWGFLTGFVTRFTNRVRVIEPLLVFVMAYLSFLTAETFRLSSILAITFCGICAKNYVETNVSIKSHTTIKYAIKMLSSVSETIIFLFLGVSVVNNYHDWNTWFVLFTILFCTVYRAVGVVLLTRLANHFRLHKLNKVEEFVMAYGGLRGAVAFALALTIDVTVVEHKMMFVTATTAVVYFTVLFQGITIKPLVQLFGVKKNGKRKLTMNERIHERFMDHLMAGFEGVLGHAGNYRLRDKFKYYDNKYLRKWLVRDHRGAEPKILETFSKLNLRDAKELLEQNGSCLSSNGPRTEASLTSLFQNDVQTDRKWDDKNASDVGNASVCNLDMKELDCSVAAKDMNDASLHHILKDAMLQTSQGDGPEPQSPFNHMVRVQKRHRLSEQYETDTKITRRKNVVTSHGNLNARNGHLSPKISESKNDASSARIYVVGDRDDEEFNSYLNRALEDEVGIAFTTQPLDEQGTSSSCWTKPSGLPTSTDPHDDHLGVQRGFPPFVPRSAEVPQRVGGPSRAIADQPSTSSNEMDTTKL